MTERPALWPWVLGLTLALGASLWFGPASGARPGSSLEDWQLLGDAKLRRTARRFADDRAGERPLLAAQNREGLVLDLELEPRALAAMRLRINREFYKERSTKAWLSFGGAPPVEATAALRGSRSLDESELLSFKIKLARPETLAEGVELRRFYLMALIEDPHQLKTRAALSLLARLDLFPLYHQYVRLQLNGEPQGIALLVEPPERGVRRLHPAATALYRRGSKPNLFETTWSNGSRGATAGLDALRALNARPGVEAPVARYAEVLDLDAYLRFVAAASILRNEDTLAELFLYETHRPNGKPEPLRCLAWDVEDIGFSADSYKGVPDPLFFFAEGLLDFRIHSSPELFARYRRVLADLLFAELSFERVRAAVVAARDLRDGLDDGSPAADQRAAREARGRYAAELIELLRQRNARLVDELERRSVDG